MSRFGVPDLESQFAPLTSQGGSHCFPDTIVCPSGNHDNLLSQYEL